VCSFRRSTVEKQVKQSGDQEQASSRHAVDLKKLELVLVSQSRCRKTGKGAHFWQPISVESAIIKFLSGWPVVLLVSTKLFQADPCCCVVF